MKKIILFIASSLDGYIARKNQDVDWLFTDNDYGYQEFYNQIDTVIMGRKTYQQALSFGDYPYSDKQSFVISRTLTNSHDNNVQIVQDNLENLINQLRLAQGSNIWLVGGAKIIDYFRQKGWIDEIILSIHPIILGEGIPLIIPSPNLETKLQLNQVKTYESGLLQINYSVFI